MSLLAAGITAATLTSCGGSNNDAQVKQNQTNITKVQKEVKTLQESLDTTKAALEESLNKLNTYLKIEQIAANGDAIASLEAKIKQIQETSDAGLNEKVQALQEALDGKAAQVDLLEALSMIDSKTSKEEFETCINEIKGSYATDAEVATAIEGLEAAYAAKEDFDAAILRIKEIEDNYVSKSDYNTAIGALQEVDNDLKAAIGTVKLLDGNVVTLQDQINSLESAKATVEKLDELRQSLETKEAALQAQIDSIQAEIGEIAKNEAGEIITLQSQIDLINEKIGTISLNENNEIISLQAQINEIKQQLGDFSSSEDLKKIKGDLVYKLSEAYANYSDEMNEIRKQLVEVYHQNVDVMFDKIQRNFEHEMTGNLYKGITYIILSKTEAEAVQAEKDFEVLINNFINPAKFRLYQQLDLEIIANLDDTIDIPSGENNMTIREKLAAEVEAVKWFTDDELEAFTIYETDDEETQSQKATAYKQATQEKIDLINAATAKAETIYSFLNAYNSAKTKVNTDLIDNPFKDAKDAFNSLLDNDVYNLKNYFNCKNIDIEVTTINPVTQTEVTNTIKDLDYQLKKDLDAIDLLVEEINDYLALHTYTAAELAKINSGSGKLTYVEAKLTAESNELLKFNQDANKNIDYKNYATLNSSIEKTRAQLASDKAKVDLNIKQIKAYNTVLKYADDAKTSQIDNLANISNTIEKPEKTNIYALIDAVAKYANYVNALVEAIPEDNTDETLKTIDVRVSDDKKAIDLVVSQATSYNTVVTSMLTANTTVGNLTSIPNTIEAPEKDNIIALINAIPAYNNYLGNAGYGKAEINDLSAISLLVAKANSYDSLIKYAVAKSNYVTSYNDLVDEYTYEFISDTEKQSIVDLINDIPLYDNYITADLVIEIPEDNTDETLKTITEQYKDDTDKIDLIIKQTDKYNENLDLADATISAIATSCTNIVLDERTNINTLINAVTTYDSYISNDEYLANFSADEALINLYFAKALVYDTLIADSKTTINSVKDILDNTVEETAEEDTIIALINAVPKYDNYITANLVIEIPADNTDETLKTISQQLEEDEAILSLLIVRAQTFKDIYDNINSNTELVGLATYIENKTTAVNVGDTNLFGDDIKAKFKAEFTDLAVAANYDTAVAEFTTEEEFTNYEETILNTEGKLDLIKKNVDTFANILVLVDGATTTINTYTDLGNTYGNVFINIFKDFATYDTNSENVKDFTTKEAFDTYYNDTVKVLTENSVKVAKYENDLIKKYRSVQTKIETAATNHTITEGVADYLITILDYVYDNNTTIGYDTENDKVTVGETVADDAYTNVEQKMAAIETAITTFNSVDIAAKNLETKLINYKNNQEKNFLDLNYIYRDDAVYAPDNIDKYNKYNQAALEAWNFYLPDFDNKIAEIKYSYEIPTDNLTYDGFTEFMASLETTTDIANRYDGLELWYSENTEENPKAGQIYTITAKFEELDSAKLSDCRDYFINMLETAKNDRKDAITSAYYKGRLENSYTIYSGMMNNQYGATTTTIIMSYENAIIALDNIMLEAISAYKTDTIDSLTTIYNDYKTAYPTYEDSFTTIYNKYLTILSKDNYEYTQGEDTIKEAWTETNINKVFTDGKAEFANVYKNSLLAELAINYADFRLKNESEELDNAYNEAVSNINDASSNDDAKEIYDDAMLELAKIAYSGVLDDRYDACLEMASPEKHADLGTIYTNAQTQISNATTIAQVQTICENATNAMEDLVDN